MRVRGIYAAAASCFSRSLIASARRALTSARFFRAAIIFASLGVRISSSDIGELHLVDAFAIRSASFTPTDPPNKAICLKLASDVLASWHSFSLSESLDSQYCRGLIPRIIVFSYYFVNRIFLFCASVLLLLELSHGN